MEKITRFAVDYPVTVAMMVLGILLLGMISLNKLNIDLFPEISTPRIFIEMEAGELPPDKIEGYVHKLESMIIRQKGVTGISAVCKLGSAKIAVEYSWGKDMDEAMLDLQKAIPRFGAETGIERINITRHDRNASPVMIISMQNPQIKDLDEMRKIGEGYIRGELVRLEGIADVSLSGFEEKQLVITTDQYRLNAFGLTVDQIVQQVKSFNQSVSGGNIVEEGIKYTIKGRGLLEKKEDLENMVVGHKNAAPSGNTYLAAATPGNQSFTGRVPIFLKEVATIAFETKEPDNIVRLNGERCIGLAVYRETGYNTVIAVERLQETITDLEKALPGYTFTIVQNQGTFIKTAISEVEESAIIGSIIAIIVLFFFLRQVGVTLLVSFAIPVSVVATFNLMYFNDLSLNIMTLGGLALGAGMLVDNAIVVIENIFRNIEEGLSVKEAAIKGTAQVGGAIMASTLTTIVVFLPIVYLSGPSSALFKDQAWTVSFSLLASLFVAILFIPMMFHQFYRKKEKFIIKTVRISWYGKLLSAILDKRKLVIVASILIVGVTAGIAPLVGSEFLPKSGANEFKVSLTLKEGTYLSKTDATVHNVESMLQSLLGPHVESIYSLAGASSGTSAQSELQESNIALIKVKLKAASAPRYDEFVLSVRDMLSGISELQVKVEKDESSLFSSLGQSSSPLTVEVKGKDQEELERLSTKIKESLLGIPELIGLETSIEEGAPEINVIIDRYKASLYGLNANSITAQLKGQLMGREAGHFEKSGELNEIIVKLPKVGMQDFNAIKIKGNNIEIPLSEVAHISTSLAPKQLMRNNQIRIAEVKAGIQGDLAYDQVMEKVKQQLSLLEVPAGYFIRIRGEEEQRQEAMSGLGFALMLSIILVYMVMASQFESFVHPFTILLTIPLAGIGSIWAFFILGYSFNMMAFIGLIMLAGIAVNNSIILVDAINQLKAEGKQLRDAIIQAGENRIRPIIMTSLTTILALVPLSLGFGESASLRSPLAIAIISGLFTSTLLTLVVIPCVYYVFDKKDSVVRQ